MRIKETYSGIYAIVNPIGELYIGQTWDTNKRFHEHALYKSNSRLSRSIKRFGFDRHFTKVLYSIPFDSSQELLNSLENFFYNQFKEAGMPLMNHKIANGARGKMSDSEKLNMVIKMTGKPKSEEHKRNISIASKGRIFSDEHKRNIGLSRTRIIHKKHTEESKAKISKANTGKIMPRESVERIRGLLTGRKLSDQHKANISKGLTGNKPTIGMKGKRHSIETIEKMRVAAIQREKLKKASINAR